MSVSQQTIVLGWVPRTRQDAYHSGQITRINMKPRLSFADYSPLRLACYEAGEPPFIVSTP